jgi:hypothetical protein
VSHHHLPISPPTATKATTNRTAKVALRRSSTPPLTSTRFSPRRRGTRSLLPRANNPLFLRSRSRPARMIFRKHREFKEMSPPGQPSKECLPPPLTTTQGPRTQGRSNKEATEWHYTGRRLASSSAKVDKTKPAPGTPRKLVPFEPDSELWPYPRQPLDDRALDDDGRRVRLQAKQAR